MSGVLEVPRTEWVPGQTAMPVPGVRRIGSLFSGYEGLGMAVQQVLGGELAWVSDIDPGACKILAHRFPEVPNIGDITAVDWDALLADLGPVDVLTGGFPCQDVSCAGLQLGMKPGTRSGLWSQMAYAISVLRPSLVVIENVRGLLSAPAHSELEPCPWCLGDDEPVALRALGGVLGDLADLGYDAVWHGLRAADVGAPHGRFRVFVVAWPAAADAADHDGRRGAGAGAAGGRPGGAAADAHNGGRGGRAGQLRSGRRAEPAHGGAGAAADPVSGRRDGWSCDQVGLKVGGVAAAGPGDRSRGGSTAADASGNRRDEGWAEPAGQLWGPDVALGGAAVAADPDGHAVRAPAVPLAGGGAATVAGDAGADAAADPHADQRAREREEQPRGDAAAGRGARAATDPDGLGCGADDDVLPARQPDVEWGAFGPAVRRWERLTRSAPAPTVQDWDRWQRRRDSAIRRRRSGAGMPPVGRRGSVEPLWTPPPHRLNPAFVEWMMGLPEGHVTDVPGLTRPEQLKALGNGVVPQQAAAALRVLLADVGLVAA